MVTESGITQYSKEELKLKMLLQIELMKYLLGENASREEKIKWAEENSLGFRNFFEGKRQNRDFLERAQKDTLNLVKEIASELWPDAVRKAA